MIIIFIEVSGPFSKKLNAIPRTHPMMSHVLKILFFNISVIADPVTRQYKIDVVIILNLSGRMINMPVLMRLH